MASQRQEAVLKDVATIGAIGGTGLGIVYGIFRFVIPAIRNKSSSTTAPSEPPAPQPVDQTPAPIVIGGGSGDTGSAPVTIAPSPTVTPVPSTPTPNPTVNPVTPNPITVVSNTTYAGLASNPNLIEPLSGGVAVTRSVVPVNTYTGSGYGPTPNDYNVLNPITGLISSIPVTSTSSPTAKTGAPEFASSNYVAQEEIAGTVEGEALTQENQAGFGVGASQPLLSIPKGVTPISESNPGETSSPGVLNASVLREEGQLSPNLTAEELLGMGNTENFSPYSVSNTYTQANQLLQKGYTPTQIRNLTPAQITAALAK